MKTPFRLLQTGLLPAFLHLWFATAQAQLTWITNNGTIEITGGCPSSPGSVVIPETINGLPVTSIGMSAFSGCTSLTNVVIPNSVTSIGSYAFRSCSGLKSIFIPDSVSKIGSSAFAVSGLSTIRLSESLRVIETGTFVFTDLRDVVIPASVSLIEGGYIVMWLEGYEPGAFWFTSLSAARFEGNAPEISGDDGFYAFGSFNENMTIYYLPGTTDWGATFDDKPTALWILPEPVILKTPGNVALQTNGFGFRISWATNSPVVVEATTSLSAPDWSPVSTNALVDGWVDFRDPAWAEHGQRYYRVRGP